MNNVIYEKAYAKINLGLEVKKRRADGYHDLDMIMVSIDHFDTLSFSIDSKITVTSDVFVCDMAENIIYKTAKIMQEKYQVAQGASITIIKRIKIGGGIGGGSSDAAATIKGLNHLWNLQMSDKEMYEIAEMVGSDVSFCLHKYPARVTGKGEKIESIKIKKPFFVLLICPDYAINTKDIYELYDKKFHIPINLMDKLENELKSDNIIHATKYMHNDLEETVYEYLKEHKLKTNYEIIREAVIFGANRAIMTGSGSTIICFASTRGQLVKIKKQIQQKNKDYKLVIARALI